MWYAMLRRPGMMSYIAILSAALVLLPVHALSAERIDKPLVVSVQPIPDGDMDEESRAVAEMISDGLGFASPYHIIDPRVAGGVVEYHDVDTIPNDAIGVAESKLSEAKDDYFNFRYSKAWAKLQDAIADLKAMDVQISGPYLIDAYLTRAIIAKSRGDADAVKESFAEALVINPKLELLEDDYPPTLIRSFAVVREGVEGLPSGELEISTKPSGAMVSLNGVSQCETPCVIEGLPVGSYSMSVKANKYAGIITNVRIDEGKRKKVSKKLKWASKGGKKSGDGDVVAQVRRGIHIAGILKADKVILVDVDDTRGGLVTARVVDRRFGVGLKPILYEGAIEANQVSMGADMTRALVKQLAVDPTKNPAALTDPVGTSDPVLLGKQKKPIYRKPLFWGAIGVVVAGAIAGGVAAAMSGGGDDGPGDVRVRFQR
jgi:PEGA domain-containing protein